MALFKSFKPETCNLNLAIQSPVRFLVDVTEAIVTLQPFKIFIISATKFLRSNAIIFKVVSNILPEKSLSQYTFINLSGLAFSTFGQVTR